MSRNRTREAVRETDPAEQPECSARLCVVCTQPAHTPGEECDAGEACPTERVHLGMTCRWCWQRMDRQLRELPEEYALAAAELLPGAGGERGGESSLGLRIAALDLRSGADLLGVLGEWEREWREFFEDPEPSAPPRAQADHQARGDRVGANVVAVCAWLRENLIRACRAHPAVDDFAHELSLLHQQARVAARTGGRRHKWVECPTDTDTGRCGAQLKLTGLELTDEVYCRACRATRDVHRLLLVAAADAESGVWLPAEDVALLLGLSTRTLRDWGKRGLVQRRSGLYELRSVRKAIADGATRGTATA